MSGPTELRVRCRLAWNNWPDSAEARQIIADQETKDAYSAAAWDRVITTITATLLSEQWMLAPKTLPAEMLAAFDRYNDSHVSGVWTFQECWDEVLAASPAHCERARAILAKLKAALSG